MDDVRCTMDDVRSIGFFKNPIERSAASATAAAAAAADDDVSQ